MKKLFLFGAAAIAMLASCQKTEVDKTLPGIDDSQPVAMQFNVNSSSFNVTKTKAAVDEWNETEVFIYGLENYSATEYVALIDNYATTVIDDQTPLEVYQPESVGVKVPYFYTEEKTYDFFGYHLGGAELATADDTEDDEVADDELQGDETETEETETEETETEPAKITTVAHDITFDGSNDVMYAYTDKDEDILKDPTAQVMAKDVYSAWAARRNVQPTLVFEHALTRFNFYVKGMNEKSNAVVIESISAESKTAGTLTVVAKNNAGLGFVATGEATEVELKKNDDSEFVATAVVYGETFVAGGEGASLMLAPGMTELPIVVEMSNSQYPGVAIPNYEFTAKAAEVRKTGLAENAGITTFEAGTAYNIYINVYGPEQIVITAELTEWAEGGDFTYDPDATRPDGTPSTFVNAEITSISDGEIAASFTTSDDVAGMRAALKAKSTQTIGEFQDVVLTKAQEGSLVFRGLNKDEIYTLVVEYTTDLAEAYETADNVEITVPAKVTTIAKSYVVTDKASFDASLPATYKENYPWDENTQSTLPWLAVEFTPTNAINVEVTYSYDGKTFKWKENFESATNFSLLTLNADELGREITEGTWTVTVNGASTEIVVPGEPVQGFNFTYVYDKESYETGLWASYLEAYPWDQVEVTDFPWLAIWWNEEGNAANYTLKFQKNRKDLTLVASEFENGPWQLDSENNCLVIENGKTWTGFTLTSSVFVETAENTEFAPGTYTAIITYAGKEYKASVVVE